MAQQLNIEITLDGSLLVKHFTSLVLTQSIHHHHNFTLRFNQDLKSGDDPVFLSKYDSYLGKTITITFGEDYYSISKNHQETTFRGYITDVQMSSNNADAGSIVVSGFGASCVLDSVKTNSAHVNKSIEQIFKAITKTIPGNALSMSVNAKINKRLKYLVQYKETSWNFLKRISATYGEWLFYNGNELFLGKPNNMPSIELSYPHQISMLSYSIQTAPILYKANTYMLDKAKKTEDFHSKKANIKGLGNFTDKILSASEDVYTLEGESLAHLWQDKADLETEVNARIGGTVANLASVSGLSDHPEIQVGTIADIKKDGTSLGKFIIIEVTHSANGNGNYNNSFKAIPADIDFLPLHSFEAPVAETQIAEVISNECPDGMGKIKVRLMGYNFDSADYPWIDVITPSAGEFKSNDPNRGIHFTPEVGDYVVVSFIDGDPSKPIASGSIATYDRRSNSSNKNNFEKTISTRSGNTIYFRDKEDSDEQEVRIETNPDNYVSIKLKGKDGTISIKSTKDIIVESEKLIDIRTSDFKIRAKNVSIETEKDISISSKGKTTLKSEDSTEISANKGIKAESMDAIKVNATQALQLNGLDVEIKGTKSLNASGAMTELAGSALTTIKGALVKIN